MDPVILTIIPYLSDWSKLQLLSTCKTYRELLPHAEFTRIYNYNGIKNIPGKFKNVQFIFNISRNQLENQLQNFTGFNLGLIPKCVNILYYDSDIRINDVLTENITEILLASNIPIFYLPPTVKTIRISINYYHNLDHLKHVNIIRIQCRKVEPYGRYQYSVPHYSTSRLDESQFNFNPPEYYM